MDFIQEAIMEAPKRTIGLASLCWCSSV